MFDGGINRMPVATWPDSGRCSCNGGTSLTGERVVSPSWIADTFAGGIDSRAAFAARAPAITACRAGMYRNQCWFPHSGQQRVVVLGEFTAR